MTSDSSGDPGDTGTPAPKIKPALRPYDPYDVPLTRALSDRDRARFIVEAATVRLVI